MNTLEQAYRDNVINVPPDSNNAQFTGSVIIGVNVSRESLVMPEMKAEAKSVSMDNHGFKWVEKLADGKPGVEVTIKRRDGTQVTIQLCEGARGAWYNDLKKYGEYKLQGATLISRDDFVTVADSLLKAIKGFTVSDGVLQTEDEALKKAYQIVAEGVRRDDGFFSYAHFYSNDGGGVSGRRVHDIALGSGWDVNGSRSACAAFVSPPAESK